MNLSRRITDLPFDCDREVRRAAIKLAAELSIARAKISALEAENMGLRDSLRGLNRHEGLAKDFTSIREAERTACAALVDSLGLHEAAKRIMERE
jgi:hypothetical protein